MHRFLFVAATCALSLQLGCSTTQPKTTEKPPADTVGSSMASAGGQDPKDPYHWENVPEDWLVYSFNHFVVSLPSTIKIDASEAGLLGKPLPEDRVECGRTFFEMTYVKTAKEIVPPEGSQISGEECHLVEYEFLLPVPNATTSTPKARVICKAYREQMKDAVKECADIVGFIRPLASDDEPIRGAPITAPIVRAQPMKEAFNDHGDEEYFLPGASVWWGTSLLGQIEVGPDSAPVYVLDEGVEARGHGVLLLAPNGEGEYVTERLEDIARLAYKKESSALHVFYQGDEGECKVLVRSDGGDVERSTSMSCPKDHAKWGTFLLGS